MASRGTAWTLAVLAVLSFAVFVWLQFASIDTGTAKDFLSMVFSSFFFLGIATFLAMIVSLGPTVGQKALAVTVSIILIIGTVFVANSLTQYRRGDSNTMMFLTMDNFVLNMQGHRFGDQLQYQGTYSKVIQEPNYSASYIYLMTPLFNEYSSSLTITLLTPANVNGTCYIGFVVNPYEYNTYPMLSHEVIFRENATSQVIDFNLRPIWSSGPRGKFEEHSIEFRVGLDLSGNETESSVLNFTVAPQMKVEIQESIVMSTFQNNLAVALCGFFIGINTAVIGSFAHSLFLRMRNKKEANKQQ